VEGSINNLPTVAIAHREILAAEVVVKAGELLPADSFSYTNRLRNTMPSTSIVKTGGIIHDTPASSAKQAQGSHHSLG